MRAVDLIIHKRDGGELDEEQIRFFVAGVTDGSWPDYQATALLMAILIRGMSSEETAWLTDAMVRSGVRVDLTDIDGVKVDKHSTGGVGDKTSLIVAPVAAACGLKVPMTSGRGLGHTGGTLDKLASIPGFRSALTLDEIRTALARVGCAIVGQTAEVVPADKTLYALRDVSGTVESLALISASIMSKKIASGIDALVLDVKTGSGAFMKTDHAAWQLAESLVSIGRSAGLKSEAVVTTMDAPLGFAVGNALEVKESLDVLKGGGPADLVRLSVELAARMVLLGRAASDLEEAEALVRHTIASGAALERFRRIIESQGGDARVVDDLGRLPTAPRQHMVRSPRAGFVTALDAELIGRATVLLGAGRDRVLDQIDPSVGIVLHAKPGDAVSAGDAVVELHYRDATRLAAALPLATRSLEVGDTPVAMRALIAGDVR
jgi:pyrimidine-nucleoside phosphorylase